MVSHIYKHHHESSKLREWLYGFGSFQHALEWPLWETAVRIEMQPFGLHLILTGWVTKDRPQQRILPMHGVLRHYCYAHARLWQNFVHSTRRQISPRVIV
ncbi:hypothetical protein BDV39DRAFT_152569 [Aspergillus sergii]|uniref:Uncharacterized protein n=1 Tax=Aspergillus sergii TaxID=1034303 RepID=A0A5N6WPW6_9EURO|nr:hypothetical protein BDV39DRAFT_152569 [Aspergillus sergii]